MAETRKSQYSRAASPEGSALLGLTGSEGEGTRLMHRTVLFARGPRGPGDHTRIRPRAFALPSIHPRRYGHVLPDTPQWPPRPSSLPTRGAVSADPDS